MKRRVNRNTKIFLVCIILFVYSLQLNAQQPRPVPVPYPNGTPVNYVRIWEATAPEQDQNIIMARPLKDVRRTTQYFDGLGRAFQTVIKEGAMETGSPANDLVDPVEYDALGREQYKYLPFAANTVGNYPTNDGKFKMNPFQQQAVFMTSQYSSQGETFFYSKSNFETSPLDRITDLYSVGISWVGSESNSEPSRRNIQKKYITNTLIDAVRIWTVTNSSSIGQFGTYTTSSIYSAGELYKYITIDEHKKQVIEFKDKEGNLILKKVQLTATSDDGSGSNHNDWICTYYIYDEFNRLRCIIQPEAVKQLIGNWALNGTQLLQQCFRYEYDKKNHLVLKKIPGVDESYMIYDAIGRLVMTQEANMRQGTNKWLVTKYDDINRPVETGLWIDNTPFAIHVAAASGSTNYPTTTSAYELLTINHYDNYNGLPSGLSATYISDWIFNFAAASNTQWPYPQWPTQSNNLRGLITWTQTKILGTANTFLYSATIYDDKSRPIQIQSTNIAGGIDVVSTQYTWAGQQLVNVQKQGKQGTNPQTHIIVTKMDYDDLGRLLKVRKAVYSNINSVSVSKPEQTIVQNEYNRLGQLKKRILGNSNLETLDYEHNIRGWLLGVNRNYTKDINSNNYFGFDLGYDKANNNIIGNQTYTNPQYNGNIEGMVWKSKGDGEKRKYDFIYDASGRLLNAEFTQYSGSVFDQSAGLNYNMKIGDGNPLINNAYDANGNILRMQQWGWKLTGSVLIDDMKYTYVEGSNKLKSVVDFSNDVLTKLGDFKTKNTHPQNAVKSALTINSTQPEFDAITDYNYDVNGNLTLDNNKSITNIVYNHLNLPATIYSNNGDLDKNGNPVLDIISYTYDASGRKLEKKVDDALGDVILHKKTSYFDGLVYEDEVLQFIPQEEGRIRFKPASGDPATFEYDYMIKDHLGNVRAVLTEEVKTDKYPAATLENVTYQGGSAVSVESLYYNIDYSKIVDQSVATGIPTYQNNNNITNPNYYSNTGANSDRLYRLDATNNYVQDKNGLGIVLKVMAGDAINIWGKSYHKMPSSGYNSSTNPLSVVDLMNLLASSSSVSPKGITGTQISQLPGFPTNVTTLLNNQPPQSTNRPRASINWVILDEQFKYVSGGFDMVGEAANSNGTFKNHIITGSITIPKNGYIYVYCSNESQYPVFFDNLQIFHERGPILEETHYYPFGLTMAGISSKAAGKMDNNYKYSSKEKQGNEFNDGSGLELYDYRYRLQDPQIGRMWQVDPLAVQFPRESPYAYGGNNPISNIDVDGLFRMSKQTEAFLKKYYPKTYKFLTSKEAMLKLASNPKLLSAFEKLGYSEKDVRADYTPGSGAELRVVKGAWFRGQTSEAYFGKVIEISTKMLDVLESAKTPQELEAGMLAVGETLTHEEGHRVSLLKGNNEPNNYTKKEDGAWLSEQIWGQLDGYWDFQSPSTDDPNFINILLNSAMRMINNQNQQEDKEHNNEQLEPRRAPRFY